MFLISALDCHSLYTGHTGAKQENLVKILYSFVRERKNPCHQSEVLKTLK